MLVRKSNIAGDFREEVIVLKGRSNRLVYGSVMIIAGILAIIYNLQFWNVMVLFSGLPLLLSIITPILAIVIGLFLVFSK